MLLLSMNMVKQPLYIDKTVTHSHSTYKYVDRTSLVPRLSPPQHLS